MEEPDQRDDRITRPFAGSNHDAAIPAVSARSPGIGSRCHAQAPGSMSMDGRLPVAGSVPHWERRHLAAVNDPCGAAAMPSNRLAILHGFSWFVAAAPPGFSRRQDARRSQWGTRSQLNQGLLPSAKPLASFPKRAFPCWPSSQRTFRTNEPEQRPNISRLGENGQTADPKPAPAW